MATADDLATYLGVDIGELNADRATMLLGQAESLAVAIVDPLPDGADTVILSAAARAYANPTGATSESVGGYSVSRPWPGVYLTKPEKRTLRQLAGKLSGAFTVDPTPADAMCDYRDPLEWPSVDTLEDWQLDSPDEL